MGVPGTTTRFPGNTALTFLGRAGTVTGSKYIHERLRWTAVVPRQGEKVLLP